MNKKRFPTHAIMTMKTRICMGDFGVAQELAEWVMGHPVWTHELLSLAKPIKEELERQFPDLPTEANKDNWKEVLATAIETHGEHLEVIQGSAERTQNPIESLVALVGEDKVLPVATIGVTT